jgi:hypothetical protein
MTDGSRLALIADDERLLGVTIEPYPQSLMLPPLTRRQLRLQLLSMGITSGHIATMIADMPEPARSIAQIEWEDATQYARDHPLVATLGAQLGLSDARLDTAWREALAR